MYAREEQKQIIGAYIDRVKAELFSKINDGLVPMDWTDTQLHQLVIDKFRFRDYPGHMDKIQKKCYEKISIMNDLFRAMD